MTGTFDVLNKNELNILLVNARSLRPKLYSLIDTMQELDGHIALLTETWFHQDRQLDITLEDMKNALGYDCIRRDRTDGREGGGVAIFYKMGDLQLQQIKVETEFEIVAAIDRRTGQRRKMVVLTIYITPSLEAEGSDKALEELAALIGRFKSKYQSPYFLIGGDFNKRNVVRELRPYTDISLIQTPPTRGNNTLDLVFTNFDEHVTRAGVTDPIHNLQGTETDHFTVFVNTKVPRVPAYQIETYTYLRQLRRVMQNLNNI